MWVIWTNHVSVLHFLSLWSTNSFFVLPTITLQGITRTKICIQDMYTACFLLVFIGVDVYIEVYIMSKIIVSTLRLNKTYHCWLLWSVFDICWTTNRSDDRNGAPGHSCPPTTKINDFLTELQTVSCVFNIDGNKYKQSSVFLEAVHMIFITLMVCFATCTRVGS